VERCVEVESVDEVAVVRLARGKVNALDTPLLTQLVACLEDVQRSDAGAIVLTGAGRAFSAGVDLSTVLEGGPDYLATFLPALSAAFEALFGTTKPTVAAINGHAIAGGCILACACDVRVMADGPGRIGVTELHVGVPFPAAALEILRFAVRPDRVQELVYGAQTYPPADALALGLVDAVVPADELVEAALTRARTLARIPAGTFALTKRQLRGQTVARIAQDRGVVDAHIDALWASPAVTEAVRRFVERMRR
jgi:enoyl-CoA hydratase